MVEEPLLISARYVVQYNTFAAKTQLTFVLFLGLNLSEPQRKHLLRTADAIIVCEGRKTLANLYWQWVKAPDASAVADFFRVSP